jgi:hypothetical protein
LIVLRHHFLARRFVELDSEHCRFRTRRWKDRCDSMLRRPIPRYYGLYQVLAGIDVALYVHAGRLYVKVDTACLPVTEELKAYVEVLEDGRRRFVLTLGGTAALDLEYSVSRDWLARWDTTPFRDLTDEDLPTMIARILRDPDEQREMIADWSEGLTVVG